VANKVNLDALIPREDFTVKREGTNAPQKDGISLTDLQRGEFFFASLRKPDFQRETAEWTPARVAGLIRTFIQGDLVPGIILWRNREMVFVIDGSHRLSALIAWVQNDFGDGARSQEFFDHDIPDEQLKSANQTRDLVEAEFGTYQSHRDAAANPSAFGPDVQTRALRFGTLTLQVQWVPTENSVQAERSFIRINQSAAMISSQELELIESRRKPNAITARAIFRRATGHKYWDSFSTERQTEIEAIATDIHRMLFEPHLKYPLSTVDLPPGGAASAAPALRMVFDFINLCVGTPSAEDDSDGVRTMEYLQRCRRVLRLLLSNEPSSLGLHPGVYFYSWTGKQQPILFLTTAALIIDLDQTRQLDSFTRMRGSLEAFLVSNRPLVNQLVRKFGSKASGKIHLRHFYDRVLDAIRSGASLPEMVGIVRSQPEFKYLQPEEQFEEGGQLSFSTNVKSGVAMRTLLASAPKCAICSGFLPRQAMSLDHIQRVADGGSSTAANAQLTHPYCNHGFKEGELARQHRASL